MPNYASQGSRRGRNLTLLLVIVFHGVLIAGLLVAARWSPRRIAPPPPLEIVFLAREPRPEPPPPPRPATRPANDSKTPTRVPAPPVAESSLTVVPATAAPAPARRVDWDQEAHIVAAERAHQEPPPPIPQFRSEQAPNSVFAPKPAHHRGDEEPVPGGTAVYVSEDCYQIAPTIPVVQDALHNGMALPIYCNSKSKTPRGDLFDQLPAYEKLHPKQ